MKKLLYDSVASRFSGRLARPGWAIFALVIAVLFSVSDSLAVFGDKEGSGSDLVLTQILIEGNEHTDQSVILRELGMAVGDAFNYEKMDRAWDTLEDIGYFAFVDMDYEEDDEGQVTWNIRVEEDMTTGYGPLVRYSRRHKYEVGLQLAEQNFRGKAETLKFDFAALYRQRLGISWHRPWLFNQKGLDATFSVMAQNADFVFRPTEYRQRHVDLTLRWQFIGDFYAKAGTNYGQDDYRDRYSWVAPDRGDGPGPLVEYDPVKQTRTSFTAAVGFDSRSNPYYPRHGIFVETGVRHWQSDQFDSYSETNLDARFFIPVPWGQHTLALRGLSRKVDGPAHLDNVLFYGGPETVRGYRFGMQEGDEGYLLSAEYRIPLFIMPISPQGELVGLGFHFFADAGDAWYEGAEAGKALQSLGSGIHLNLDRMQLRFEAAKPSDGDWRFEFLDTFNF